MIFKNFYNILTTFILVMLFIAAVDAQKIVHETDAAKSRIAEIHSADKASESSKEEESGSSQKYRLLQSNEFFVDTPFHQEEGELQHTFSFTRTNRRNLEMTFTEELPLFNEKHQLSISIPAQLVGNGNRGFGDTRFEYTYALLGNGSSRVAVSPGFGLSIPTGSVRKELGAGGTGFSLKLPVAIMLTKRFALNSSAELTYVNSAKNDDGDKANTINYELGQGLVWFAKPKLNFLIETVWERSQEITGPGLKRNEYEFFISPGVRWAYVFRSGLIVSPGIAVPIGVGPTRGENGVFFYLAFEHSLKKER